MLDLLKKYYKAISLYRGIFKAYQSRRTFLRFPLGLYINPECSQMSSELRVQLRVVTSIAVDI
jgi:hypothetical protein